MEQSQVWPSRGYSPVLQSADQYQYSVNQMHKKQHLNTLKQDHHHLSIFLTQQSEKWVGTNFFRKGKKKKKLMSKQLV